MSLPTQRCTECGLTEIVKPDGRGFPPDIAKRRLAKRCAAAGHESKPVYKAGIAIGQTRVRPTHGFDWYSPSGLFSGWSSGDVPDDMRERGWYSVALGQAG